MDKKVTVWVGKHLGDGRYKISKTKPLRDPYYHYIEYEMTKPLIDKFACELQNHDRCNNFAEMVWHVAKEQEKIKKSYKAIDEIQAMLKE